MSLFGISREETAKEILLTGFKFSFPLVDNMV